MMEGSRLWQAFFVFEIGGRERGGRAFAGIADYVGYGFLRVKLLLRLALPLYPRFYPGVNDFPLFEISANYRLRGPGVIAVRSRVFGVTILPAFGAIRSNATGFGYRFSSLDAMTSASLRTRLPRTGWEDRVLVLTAVLPVFPGRYPCPSF
jgi:hypothetical protein